MSNIPADVVKDLAPTGELRAAINLGNVVLAQKDTTTGELKGVTTELARALAARLGVPLKMIPFDAAGKVFDALKDSTWDIAFLAVEPVRAAEIEFTDPYVLIEGSYMVPAESPIKSIEDVDQAGHRIAVGKGAAYDLYLTRTIKHATLVRAPTSVEAVQMFVRDKLEVCASVNQLIAQFAEKNSGLRIVKPRFMAIRQAAGTPKGRLAGAAYLAAFIEEQKRSGFVADALKRSNQPDAVVAPPAGH